MIQPKKSPYHTDDSTLLDHLNFSDFRPALLYILLEAETPLTVGVFGPWGSGKTSLLQMLKDEIDKKGNPFNRTVWFTAWKYDRDEALWRAFILRVIEGLYPKNVEGKRIPTEQIADEAQRKQVEQLDRIVASLYETVTWEEKGEWSLDWVQTKKELAKLPASLLLRLANLGGIAEAFEIDPKLAEIVQQETRKYRLEHLVSMEQFEKTFQEALELILGDKGRLIVFVDDLDRCLPEKVVEVLEAIKLFLHVPHTVFVLGMDREVVERGVESHYGILFHHLGVERKEFPISGDAYLQKLVQIPFQLPPLGLEDIGKYIEALETGRSAEERLTLMTRQVFARGLLANPRQVKRALNIFHLLKEIALKREEQGKIPKDLIAWPLLAKTVLIQSQWPELYRLWRSYPTLVQTLEEAFRRAPTSEEEIILGRLEPEPESGGLVPVASRGEQKTDRTGGIMSAFINDRQKYDQLALLLNFPEMNGAGRDRAWFAGLSRSEISVYVNLAGVTESSSSFSTPSVQPTDELLRGLSSGDQVLIRDAIAQLDEREPDASGPLHSTLRQALLRMMQDDKTHSANVRVAAGNGLAELGDPRFLPEKGYLPDEADLGFVEIPSGYYSVGEGDPAEEVFNIPRFFIARYPVTTAQFTAYLNEAKVTLSNPSSLAGKPTHPICYVYWDEALAYCKWLELKLKEWLPEQSTLHGLIQKEKVFVTLPSEMEWEKAARGDRLSNYPFGDNFVGDRANTKETGLNGTSPVGAFPSGANSSGLHDMFGNVWEWTRSRYRLYPYIPNDGREDLKAKGMRVLRGSSYDYSGIETNCLTREKLEPDKANWNDGFRVAIISNPEKAPD